MNNENENDDDDDEGRDRDKWRGEGLIGRRERWGGEDLRPGTLMSRLQFPCHERERKHPLHCITALRQHTISLHFTSLHFHTPIHALCTATLSANHSTPDHHHHHHRPPSIRHHDGPFEVPVQSYHAEECVALSPQLICIAIYILYRAY